MKQNILPKVGIGVIILNDKKILVGKRTGTHAQKYSIPGGHLEIGETFEDAAIREIKEETNLLISDPKVICITNNLETFTEEGLHYISIILFTDRYSGLLKNLEPEKCEEWLWVEPDKLPEPHFDASRRGVDGYLTNRFYKKYE